MRSKSSLTWVGVLTASLLTISGCRDPEVQVYDVPKDQNERSRSLPPNALPSRNDGQLSWVPAPEWETLEPNRVRRGNYLFTDETGSAEITVTAFPGNTGGLLANVNRWLGQAGLPPIGPEELDAIVDTRPLNDSVDATFVDLKDESGNPESTRIVAAIVPYGGQSWFFKMSGPHDTVGSQIPALERMVEELSFDEIPSVQEAAGGSEDDIAFRAPDGWTRTEGSAMRIASFQIDKEGYPPADFSIIAFPGDTGGVVANVNRWRRQIGLEEWTEQEVRNAAQSITNDYGHRFLIYDLKPVNSGSGSGQERILAAILEHAGKSWFFKLRGEPFLVDTQSNKFRSLLLSVHFDHTGHSH